MDRIPYYILCEILTSVGPINEIYQLSLVCKGWYRAMKNSLHFCTLNGSTMRIKKIWKNRMKFLSQWKLFELNFQGSFLFISKSLVHLINTSQPKVLNLSGCDISELKLRTDIFSYKKNKHGNENSFCNVEELRITNLAREIYDEYDEKVIGYISYELLYEIFPNLKRLYAGNTAANLKDLALIVQGFTRLEFLDISNCSSDIENIEKNSEALNYILSSNLKTLFILLKEESTAIDIIRSKGIEVITQNLGDILRNAIEEESTNKLEEWLKSGGDPNLLEKKPLNNQEWADPLLTLVEKNIDGFLLMKVIKIMIKKGANFSYQFFCAVICKNMVGLAELLMASGCNIWYRVKSSINGKYRAFVAITWATKVACEIKDFAILDIFVDNNLHKFDFFENFTECNPYCIAIQNENIELFSYLIHRGFAFWKCNAICGYHHLTPLIFHPIMLEYALFSGNFSLEQLPFDWVYDGLRYYINANNQKKASKLLKYLIPLGIKEKEKNFIEENKSTIFYCLYRSLVVLAYNHNKDCKKMLEYLAELGFDLNAVCEHETPLFIEAAEYKDIEMMTFFYNYGANINRQDFRGFTALHAAACNGHEEAVLQLINWGASISIRNNNNLTALELAEMNHRTQICLLLQNLTPKHQKGCIIF